MALLAAWGLFLLAGCGNSKSRLATEQLLVSDAVDRTVAQIDFRVLSGQHVYLDTTYLKSIKGVGFVNADYVISSLRQQIVAAGCLLEESPEDADFVIEGRLGALGTDDSEVIYGVPSTHAITSAASLLPSVPALPALPEISVARKLDYRGAAKISLFAYHRETRQPVWQSGVILARSTAKDTWVMGAGPFQYGSIYKRTRFAGDPIRIPLVDSLNRSVATRPTPGAPYEQEVVFRSPAAIEAAAKRRKEQLLNRIDSLDDGLGLLPLSEQALASPRRLEQPARVARRPDASVATPSEADKPSASPPAKAPGKPSPPKQDTANAAAAKSPPKPASPAKD